MRRYLFYLIMKWCYPDLMLMFRQPCRKPDREKT